MANENSKYTESYLDCLSMLESNTGVLYTALAERATLPSAKAILLDVAFDSQKHAHLLREVCEKLAKSKYKPSDSAKIEEVFNITYAIFRDIIAKEELTPDELISLSEKLDVLEKTLGEKYAYVQSKTQKLSEKKLNPLHNVSLDNFGSLFARMINDTIRHRELLGSIKVLIEQNSQELRSTTFVDSPSLIASSQTV